MTIVMDKMLHKCQVHQTKSLILHLQNGACLGTVCAELVDNAVYVIIFCIVAGLTEDYMTRITDTM